MTIFGWRDAPKPAEGAREMLRAPVARHHGHIDDLQGRVAQTSAGKFKTRFLQDLRIGASALLEPPLQGPRADAREFGGECNIGASLVQVGLLVAIQLAYGFQ